MSETIARATKKQQELLQFVDAFIRDHDYGPSYREIMAGLGYKSVSTVATHIEGLISKGFLARGEDGSARSLRVVSRAMSDSPGVRELQAKITSLEGEKNAPSREILQQAIKILREQ